jgi:hypothetical protein
MIERDLLRKVEPIDPGIVTVTFTAPGPNEPGERIEIRMKPLRDNEGHHLSSP